jgi:small subunit ribosomal protein S8
MTNSDPIADMLTRLRNALMAGHSSVSVPSSKIKVAIAELLKEEGYIKGVEVTDDKPAPMLRMELKYFGDRRNRRPVIMGIERMSRPGRRYYAGRKDIPWIKSGMGIVIMSTPKGVMSGQSARRQGIGGEILCKVW